MYGFVIKTNAFENLKRKWFDFFFFFVFFAYACSCFYISICIMHMSMPMDLILNPWELNHQKIIPKKKKKKNRKYKCWLLYLILNRLLLKEAVKRVTLYKNSNNSSRYCLGVLKERKKERKQTEKHPLNSRVLGMRIYC